MTSNRDRARASARARLEREMSERAERARRQRRLYAAGGAGLAALVVIGGVIWIVAATTGDDDKDATASPSSSASASAAPAKCDWKPVVDPSASPAPAVPPGTKDVGKPPADGEPRTGKQIMTVTTSLGPIKIEIDSAKTPCAAASFTYLASKKFFDNTKCHRMMSDPIYLLWCGDPSGTSTGGPSYTYAAENVPTDRRPAYSAGSVVVYGGEGGNGSNFFIVYQDGTQLPANFTILGTVTEGLQLVKDAAAKGITPTDPANPNDGAPKIEIKINTLTVAAA